MSKPISSSADALRQETTNRKSWIGGCFINKILRSKIKSLVSDWIKTGQKNKCITAINVSKVVMSIRDNKLHDYLLDSSINIADGFPIYLATHLIGEPVPERITGVDLMEDLLELANDKGYKIYFLGSNSHVLDKVINKCKAQYPNLSIAGSRNGYFKKEEEDSVVQEIASAAPDILLVGMGLPQKEYFVNDYGTQLNSSVILPVGGGFDVYAGMKKRAPIWVQKMGIEWLWRSLYDPSRAGLIIRSLIPFFFIMISEIFRQRILRRKRR